MFKHNLTLNYLLYKSKTYPKKIPRYFELISLELPQLELQEDVYHILRQFDHGNTVLSFDFMLVHSI